MARDQNDHNLEPAERYSRDNPPPDKQTAEEAIEDLKLDIVSIQTDLDHTGPDTYLGPDDYDTWRRRAVTALRYARQELAYLEYWIDPGSHWVNRRKENLQGIAQGVRARAAALRHEIECAYEPLYTAARQPENLSEAIERQAQLVGVKQRIQSAFSEITNAWTSHALDRSALSGVKSPLHQMLVLVEEEIGIVKAFLRNASTLSSQANWKSVCAQALTRAVAEGFRLTPTEQAVLLKLQQACPDGQETDTVSATRI